MEQNLKQPFLADTQRFLSPRQPAETGDLTTQVTYNDDMSLAQSGIGSGDDLFLHSTDTTLVLLYNFKTSKYQFFSQDRERLRDYYDPDIFYSQVLKQIIDNPKRMPFTQSISFNFQLFIKIFKYIILLGFVVALFYALMFFLFNPVVTVIAIVFLIWLFTSLEALEEKIYVQRRNKPLQNFLKKINQQEDFIRNGILVIAGHEGKWIEIELQDKEEPEEQTRDVAPQDPMLDEMENRRFSTQDTPVFETKKSLRGSRHGRNLSFEKPLQVNVHGVDMPQTEPTSSGGSLLHSLAFREQ